MPRRRQTPWAPNRSQRPWAPNRSPQPSDITRSYNSDSRTLVQKYGRMGAPFFRIEIGDKDNRVLFSSEASINESGYDLEGLLIYEVEYDETDCQTSMIRMTMANPKMDLQDGTIFTEGNTVDLWMGYDGLEADYMGRGFIVEISPTFEAADIPRFSVVAYDISYLLMEEGRGDIIPEGTAWYERKRRSSSTAGQNAQRRSGGGTSSDGEQGTNTSGNTTEGSASAENRATNRNADVPACPANTSCQSAAAPTSNPSRQANTNNNTRNQESGRAEWVKWKQPRRGRNNGKVWKAKSDSEIVDAIFESYGIVSYSTATSESRATVRTITSDNEGDFEVTGSTQIPDTPEEGENVPEQARQLKLRNSDIDIKNINISSGGTEDINLLKEEIKLTGKFTVQPGQTVTITTREERKVVQKNGTTDWDFIKELARKRGYIVYVFFNYDSGHWIGYWGPDTNGPQKQTYTLRYAQGDNTSLARVKPTISLREQKTEIDLQYVDPRSGKENLLRISTDNISPVYSQIRQNAATTNIDPIGDGPEVTLNIFGRRTSVVADKNFTSVEDARDWLVSFWIRHARDFCRIEGETIIGLPEIRARQHHTIEGIGRMSGNYFISKVVHRMGAGHTYTTRFNGFRKIDVPYRESDVETDTADIGDWSPPGQDTNTLYSR